MDARVTDFLNEINEIVGTNKQNKCAWKECFDKTTGYPYYWNMDSNTVTWEMPDEYKTWMENDKIESQPTETVTQENKLSVTPLFPSATSIVLGNESKVIHRIPLVSKTINFIQKEEEISSCNKSPLVPAYDSNSDTDNEEMNSPQNEVSNKSPPAPISKSNSQTNGENIDNEYTEDIKSTKSTLGFKLLANYGDDSDEDDEKDTKTESKSEEETFSTLFPSTKPIDIDQFPEIKPSLLDENATDFEIDDKAFKRKKRIGVQLINRPKPKPTNGEVEITNGSSKECKDGSEGPLKFVPFVKSDVLNANADSASVNEESSDEILDDTRKMLMEKLSFLSEGREAPSSVQILSIQLEALYAALNAGGLTKKYFTDWLKDMTTQLIKLEEETSPNGWNLEWDRVQKRYYYRNKVSDECQWDYPSFDPSLSQEDDDAMDLCTTPPHEVEDTTKSPTPGHPEVMNNVSNTNSNDSYNVEVMSATTGDPPNGDLKSALDSFYSDIAAIETASTASGNCSADDVTTGLPAKDESNSCDEPPKKKKKVKVSQGVSMRKKGVSQLVEKWKNVQKDLS